jgi:P-type conjugative transfer protein TrbL
MPQFLFLNNSLSDLETAIQNSWAVVFQQQGIYILLAIGAIALAVYAGQLVMTGDIPSFIHGLAYTIISLAVLRAVFLNSQTLAFDLLNGFLQWGQQVSGMSPAALTPSGVCESGLQLARQFWAAGGHASWLRAPLSALEQLFCVPIIVIAFGIASIIYLLALAQAYALIAAASVMLAFAALPWTWNMFPGWALTVLAACIKIFFLLCVLAIGMNEAATWSNTIANGGAGLSEDSSLLMQAVTESVLFVGLVYWIPNLMAGMVGGASLGFGAGEAIIGAAGGAVAGAAIGTAGSAITSAAGNAAASAAAVAGKASQGLNKVAQMLLR